MDDVIEAILDGLTDGLFFVRKWKFTIFLIVLIIGICAVFIIRAHQAENDCRAKGGTPFQEYGGSVVCIKGDRIK